jgi:VWFA-related protein
MVRGTIQRLARLLLAVGLIGCTGSLLSAQQKAEQTQEPDASSLSIKRTVRRVIVDVAVIDSNGKPVPGLSQNDFAVTEDGRPQQVLSFSAHDLEPDFTPPKLPPMPPNTFVDVPSGPERGPLYVLLLDLVNTETDEQPIARRQLLQFINDKPQGTRFAIFVLSDGLRLVQGFTDDHDVLATSVDPSRPKSHVPKIFLYGYNYGKNNEGLMVSVFGSIAHFLDGLPGRKALIWLSGGFPMSLSTREADPFDLQQDVKDTLDTMARAQVAVYTVDVRGVSVEDAKAGALAGGPGGAVSVGGSSLASEYMDEGSIAGVTGGRAFFSTNDIKGALAEATEAGASYYTVSYSPTNERYDGKLRHISVTLSQRGYRLSYRRSYYAEDPDSPPPSPDLRKLDPALQARPAASKPGDSLYAYMQRGAPTAHQVFFRAHVHALGAPAMGTPEQMANLQEQPAYFRVRRKNRPEKPVPPIKLQTYAIDYTVVLRAARGDQPRVLEFAAAAFDADSRMLNGLVQNAQGSTARTGSDANPEQFYRVEQEIDVPLSASSIRIAVRDLDTDHIGAMEIALPLAPEPQAQAVAPPRANKPN